MITPRMALSAVQLRELAVAMMLEGDTPEEVADILEVNESSVWRWLRRWREKGPSGLITKPGQGRRPKLSDAQGRQVLRWLDKSPCDFGFSTERWTAPRVAALIDRCFGVRMNHRYLNEWLNRRDITPQVPERQPRERKDEKIKQWVSEDWPRIKKT
jgi:transposase